MKVVCVELGESLYKNSVAIVLELHKVYYVGKITMHDYYHIMRDDMLFGTFFDKRYFITLAEFREGRLNKILE
jgi:hypothetical protein